MAFTPAFLPPWQNATSACLTSHTTHPASCSETALTAVFWAGRGLGAPRPRNASNGHSDEAKWEREQQSATVAGGIGAGCVGLGEFGEVFCHPPLEQPCAGSNAT